MICHSIIYETVRIKIKQDMKNIKWMNTFQS